MRQGMVVAGICLLLLGGCSGGEKRALTDEQLSRIMADLFVAQAASSSQSGDLRDSLLGVYTRQVYGMHHTTPDVYEREINEAALDMGRFEGILNKAEELVKNAQ